MSDLGRCRSCKLYVTWARTKRGVLMPLERAKGDEGNVVVSDGVALIVEPGQGTHVAHHMNCPQGKAWRKR